MIINELKNVFPGKVVIRKRNIVNKSVYSEILYAGYLGMLTDKTLLDTEIKHITNIPGKINYNPYIVIYTK